MTVVEAEELLPRATLDNAAFPNACVVDSVAVVIDADMMLNLFNLFIYI